MTSVLSDEDVVVEVSSGLLRIEDVCSVGIPELGIFLLASLLSVYVSVNPVVVVGDTMIKMK